MKFPLQQMYFLAHTTESHQHMLHRSFTVGDCYSHIMSELKVVLNFSLIHVHRCKSLKSYVLNGRWHHFHNVSVYTQGPLLKSD